MAAICRSTIIKESTPLKSEWALRSLRNDHAVYVGMGTPLISEWLRRSAGICTSLPAAFTASGSVQLLGFILCWKLALAYGLICDYCLSGQKFAAIFLQILSHGRRPWFKLYPADSGFSPIKTCAHRARNMSLTPMMSARINGSIG